MRGGAVLALALAAALPRPAAAEAPRAALEDFSGSTAGAFPSGWQARFRRGEQTHAVVEEEGNRFLRADVSADAVHVYRTVSWNLGRHPRLSWRWRAIRFPDGADERDKARNDTACGVYVTWVDLLRFKTKSIKYLWSAAVPEGTEYRAKDVWFVVARSGTRGAGTWVPQEVDVAADYRRLWGEEPGNPDLLVVMSDADATRSRAVCDYDDFAALGAAPGASRGRGEEGR